MAKKYYVVWRGHSPGVYDNWPDCQKQVHGFQGAKYKSFPTIEEAQQAYKGSRQSPHPRTKKER